MNVLDLFSGIGGFSLGLERAGMKTVAFCEIEPYCQAVLRKHWPDVPIYDDVRTLNADGLGRTDIDLICGGYPCQPFSQAGKRLGDKDDRHLWPEVSRLLDELRPAWFIGENVAGHISMGLDEVLSDLEGKGYTARPFVIPAVAKDAPHRRDRVWIVGHSASPRSYAGAQTGIHRGKKSRRARHAQSERRSESLADTAGERREQGQPEPEVRRWESFLGGDSGDVANAENMQRDGGDSEPRRQIPKPGNNIRTNGQCTKWPTEPDVGRVAHGVPKRVDRLKALGNAVVPQIPEMIGRAIMDLA